MNEMRRNNTTLALAAAGFALWLGYLAWLVAATRPEESLMALGSEFWPSRAWLAAAESIVEVRREGGGLMVTHVFRSPADGPGAGDWLPRETGEALERRLNGGSDESSWIIALRKSSPKPGEIRWFLSQDPPVPGRRQGPARLIPATPWARAWISGG
ncbi:MAG: hypothetical protein ACKO9Z_18960 [Planctomycetota bacterium]